MIYKKITYKAIEDGIQVVKVKPAYTSQRCSECGYISRENGESQETFHWKCVAIKHLLTTMMHETSQWKII